ncbi:putative tyrosinase [Rosellinia necatrix]|uniref:tyrosinase n=1 Tax=Rosellinia necatrix TaxID=77044 RepID=A0A1W2TFC7_ROSNE|nr:putative tyrosinase [Rosellinia necatrix]
MPHHVRKNLADLCTEERDKLVRAFRAIQCLKPSDPDSYFTIAGYHGIPGTYYCHHGDVLFPTWHRAYLSRLEKALQKQVHGVAMPYWDQMNIIEQGTPIPTILTDEYYICADGERMRNPLRSYTLQKLITDDGVGDGGHDVGLYNKPKGYDTVRYPFSGLVSENFKEKTEVHNAKFTAMGIEETTNILNLNVLTWLYESWYVNHEGERLPAGVRGRYKDCLNAPNYTVFSNVTSADEWNKQHPGGVIYPLESPHNSIHVAVGGFEVPNEGNFNKIEFANGDMGENETAAFDPIFFFHHAWIDYLFWNWQERHGAVHELEFMPGYEGVGDYTPESPLEPFKRADGCTTLTSQDVADVRNLGYTYDRPFSDPDPHGRDGRLIDVSSPRLRIPNLTRRGISGSFLISTWVENAEGKQELICADAVLSRWNLSSCRNCQDHLDFHHYVPLVGWNKEDAEGRQRQEKFSYRLHTRQDPAGDGMRRGPLSPIELET